MSLPESQRQWHLLGPKRIELREVAVEQPDAGALLIRIDAALTCGTDLKVFRAGGHARMLQPPCPFGHEMTGTVVATSPPDAAPSGLVDDATDVPELEDVRSRGPWEIGDRVAVANSASCGRCPPCRAERENLCSDLLYLNGAFGEYLLVPPRFVRRSVHRLPEGLDFARAALAEPLACVLHFWELIEADLAVWRRKDASSQLDLLVLGAGPLGLLIGWLAARRGLRVTVADPNRERVAAARRVGAERVAAMQRTPGRDPELSMPEEVLRAGYHVAVDASGTLAGWQEAVRAVIPGGTAVFFGGVSAGILPLRAHPLHYDELVTRGVYHHRPATFRAAIDLLAEEQLPVDELLSDSMRLDELPRALEAMLHRDVLKVHLRTHETPG